MNKVIINICFAFLVLVYSALAFSDREQGLTKENVNEFDSKGWTPLMKEIQRPGKDLNKHLENLKVLFSLGADPNLRVKGRRTPAPLDLISYLSLDVVKKLVEQGAEITDYTYAGHSMLNLASKNIETARYLLTKGANPNVMTSIKPHGTSILLASISQKKIELVYLLLEHGADPNILNKRGNSALSFAVTKRDEGLIKKLLEHGAKINGFGLLANVSGRNPDIKVAKLLLAKGIDINDKTQRGDTALHFAENFNNKVLIDFYISNGADVTIKNNLGQTYLEQQ